MDIPDDSGPAPTRVAVFCGSQAGTNPAFTDAARRLGRHLAAEGVQIVFGGGRVGLMGAVADAALEAGGGVIGVIPRMLADREIAHAGLTEMVVVETMHARKAAMADLADGFVALPGGIGTYEELFEQWTWGKLAIHTKPTMVLDVDGYFSTFIRLVDDMVLGGFLDGQHAEMLRVVSHPAEVVAVLRSQEPPTAQWVPTAT